MVEKLSQFLAEHASKGAGKIKLNFPKEAPTPKKSSGGIAGPGTPIATVLDLLTRPLDAVTNSISEVESLANKKAASQRAHDISRGDLGSTLGEFGAVLGAGIKGFTSDKQSDHPTTSQLIEKGVDAAGSYDPKYKNTANNVNPVLKGILGFVGDVGLDPTTYIPGDLILKAGQLAARGGIDAVKAAKAGAEATIGARSATKAAQVVEDAVSKAPEETAVAEPAAVAAKGGDLGTEGDILTELDKHPTPKPAAQPVTPLEPEPLPPTVAEKIAASPKTPSLTKMLEKIKAPVAQVAKLADAAAPEVDAAIPKLTKGEFLNSFLHKAPDDASLPHPERGKFGVPQNARVSMSVVRSNPQKFITEKTAKWVGDNVYPKYLKGDLDEAGAPISRAARIKPTTAPEAEAQGLVTHLSRFNELYKTKEANISKALGPIAPYLLKHSNPKAFLAKVNHISDVVSDRVNLNDITDNAKLDPEIRTAMQHLDIDVAQTNTTRMKAMSSVAEPPMNVPTTVLNRVGGPDSESAELAKDFSEAMQKKFSVSAYPHESATGVRQTSEGIGVGEGNDMRKIGTHDQWNNWQRGLKSIINQVKSRNTDARAAELFGKVKAGPQRAKLLIDSAMPKLLTQERLMDDNGLMLSMGYGDQAIPLSLHQTLTELLKQDPEVMHMVLANVPTDVPITNILDAVTLTAKRDATDEEIAQLLSNTALRNGKQGSIKVNLLDGQNNKAYGFNVATRSLNKVEPTDVLTRLTAAVQRATPKLRATVADNAERYGMRIDQEMPDLTKDSINRITSLVSDPTQVAEAMRNLSNIDKGVIEKAASTGAMSQSEMAASMNVREGAPELVEANSKGAVRAADGTKKRSGASAMDNPLAQDNLVVEQGKDLEQSRFDTISDHYEGQDRDNDTGFETDPEDGVATPVSDLAEYDPGIYHTGIMSGITKSVDPVSKMFNAKYGLGNMWSALHNMGILHETAVNGMRRSLNGLRKAGDLNFVPGTTTKYIDQAWSDLQHGITNADPAIAAATSRLAPLVAQIHDLNGTDALLSSPYLRNNSGWQGMQKYMDTFGVGQTFDVDAAKKAVKAGQYSTVHEAMADQWRTFKNVDPISYLDNMNRSALKFATDASVAQSFMKHMEKAGLSGTTRTGRMTRVVSSGHSTYLGFMPKTYYVDKDAYQILHRMEAVSTMSSQLKGPLGEFVTRNIDPITQAWKFGMTLPRPGHHIRNLIGDLSMTFLARGAKDFRASMVDSHKMLALRNEYEGVDTIAALMHYSEDAILPTGGTVLMNSKRWGPMTADFLYKEADRMGLLPSYRVSEDFLTDDAAKPGAVAAISGKLALKGTKIESGLGKISEYRDHLTRLQHFSQFIRQEMDSGKYASLDDLLEKAGDEVHNFHPSGRGLSNFEHKYARRLVPFYSWMRGALPAVVSSVALHPGRAAVFPKASFALATTMGVSPQSLSDPFPADQMFPSFLTDQATGPTAKIGGEYFSVSPGISEFDLWNTLGADPVSGIGQMINPLLRAPAELMSGAEWGSQSKIKDTSDYIDSQLPVVSYVANTTGVSPTGSLASFLSGNGPIEQKGQATGAAPNSNEARSPTDKGLSVLNWLSGLGISNVSKPSYLKYAELEQKDKNSS